MPRTMTAEPGIRLDQETVTTTRQMPLFRVILHNDDVNDFMHVINALTEVFHFERQKAVELMWEAHNTGCALCVVESKERAELHQEQLQALQLTATIEPEE